jgi:DNA-binding response OmpR family regulator
MSAPRRLVVVDDDPKVRMLLERAFRPPEFETHAFPTGRAALDRMLEVRPECVVSEMTLPDLDGERLLRAMRQVAGYESLPFVIVSALRSEPRVQAALDAGADGFLIKPFPLRELLDKVRALFARPAGAPGASPPAPYPTRPLSAVSHTMSVSPVSRRGAEPGRDKAAARRAAAALPSAVVEQRPDGSRRVELQPPESVFGFGRYTRVEARGRSIVVLTEASLHPRFVVTTVITERGTPLRKVESALAHALAREEDQETVRRQLDLQHEDALRRLEELVLSGTRRHMLWNEQSRTVDPSLLAWAMSALAQLAEVESGPEETMRALVSAREALLPREPLLEPFQVTPLGRVATDLKLRESMPRRAVAAVAAWALSFACEALRLPEEKAFEPIRHATQRRAGELERIGFYSRLRRARGLEAVRRP